MTDESTPPPKGASRRTAASAARPKAAPKPRVAPKPKAPPTPTPALAPNVATAPEAGRAGLTLYLLRHADAGDSTLWTAPDAERPLSKKGRRQSKQLARHLQGLGVRPDVILTSPKVRAIDTAKIVGKGVGRKPVVDERLIFDFGFEALAALIGGLDGQTGSVMLVGHDPDFSDALSWLVGAPLPMKKGALAAIDLPEREVGAGRGLLRWLLPPDAVAG